MSPSKTFPWILAASFLGSLALAPTAVSDTTPGESKRVVAVIVVDSQDKNIGKAVTKDGELVKSLLEDGFSKNKDRLVLHATLDGDKTTPDGILDYIDKLKVAETDTLLFYFSGHGAWDTTKGQYLQLYSGPAGKKGDLFRSTLITKLKSKKARLVLCLTDCCNREMPSRAPLTRDLKRPVSWEMIQSLLLHPTGLVDMTSSARGELSFTYPTDRAGKPQGSFFTVCLVDLFRAKITGKAPDWARAHDTVKKWTQDDYAKFRKMVIDYYNKLPDDKRTEGLKNMVALLRKQDSQTVYRYPSAK